MVRAGVPIHAAVGKLHIIASEDGQAHVVWRWRRTRDAAGVESALLLGFAFDIAHFVGAGARRFFGCDFTSVFRLQHGWRAFCGWCLFVLSRRRHWRQLLVLTLRHNAIHVWSAGRRYDSDDEQSRYQRCDDGDEDDRGRGCRPVWFFSFGSCIVHIDSSRILHACILPYDIARVFACLSFGFGFAFWVAENFPSLIDFLHHVRSVG